MRTAFSAAASLGVATGLIGLFLSWSPPASNDRYINDVLSTWVEVHTVDIGQFESGSISQEVALNARNCRLSRGEVRKTVSDQDITPVTWSSWQADCLNSIQDAHSMHHQEAVAQAFDQHVATDCPDTVCRTGHTVSWQLPLLSGAQGATTTGEPL
ncbi:MULTISPECIES: hypothetical protein [unclassified Thioalkalivibrio]|uniref:hypothetical protein n=1 Tax=unclassified Thioalkalivibrio TaxID=2621013 RepID=UPI0003A33275|nr:MULTISPECIES: hypothetical protein [unclassified Thioalkalivibrio]